MRPYLAWLERHAARAGIRVERYWSQTERATLLEIEGHTWRWQRTRRLHTDIAAELMNVEGKVLKERISGADLRGESTDDEKGWARRAYFFFRMAEHYDG